MQNWVSDDQLSHMCRTTIGTSDKCLIKYRHHNLFSPWTAGVQQHGAPVHVHAVQPEPVVVWAQPQRGEGGAMGGQGSPVAWRRLQTLGLQWQEGRWTQREVREGNARGDCSCHQSEQMTIRPCSHTRLWLSYAPKLYSRHSSVLSFIDEIDYIDKL